MKFTVKNYFSFGSHPAYGSSLKAWIRILWENKFRVHPFLIPKVLIISATIFLATPFRWYEKVRYRKKVRIATVRKPVFILGHPRSGTTFLHYLLSKDPAFGYCTTTQAIIPHLFLTWSRFFSIILSKALPATRPMDEIKMGSELPKEEEFALAAYGIESMAAGYYFPENFERQFEKHILFKNNPSSEKKWMLNFDHFLKKLTAVNGDKSLLLKSPANTARVKSILSLYPDAKFIHVYRNPFDVFQSHLHLFKNLLPLLSFQEVSDETLEEIVFRVYIQIHEKYFNERDLIPKGNLVDVRYEDLIAEPLYNIEKIYDTLNLHGFEKAKPAIEAELHTYRNYNKNRFVMNDALAAKIADRFQFVFDRFGYSTTFRHD